jgi:DNA-binding NarL/FixJ family response regulator
MVQVVFFCGDTKKAASEDIVNSKKNNMNLGAGKIQIMVVDDHPVVLEGLRQLVNQEDDLLVCAKARNAKEALETIKKQQVDLAIVDMLLENTTGVQVTEKLKLRCPNLKILVFSMSHELQYVRLAFQAGARGYITKEEVAKEILVAIRHVHSGKVYISAVLAKKFSSKALASILRGEFQDSIW